METPLFTISKFMSPSKALGRQVTIEYTRCNKKILEDAEKIEKSMASAALASGAKVVSSSFHCFEPQGISGVIIIAQSHFTIHAWPEYRYAAVDIFTCGDSINIPLAIHEMARALESEYHVISSDIQRGCPEKKGRIFQEGSDQNIDVRLTQSVPKADMIALYKDAGWWEKPKDGNLNFLDTIVKDSFLFAGAFSENTLIGMARALSDGISDAYIQDVVVLSSFRRKGLGKKLIQTLVQELKNKKIDWIGLIGEPGTGPFYEQLGFSVLQDYIPMKLIH